MRAFFEIFRLEMRRLWRRRTAQLLALAALAWIFCVPWLANGDGTLDGVRHVQLLLSLGGAFTICCVSLAASGALSFAAEREEFRLALARVRPAPRFALAAGRMAALSAAGAGVLALCACFVVAKYGAGRPCSRVIDPVMEPVAAEADRMYAHYLSLLPKLDDPATPEELRGVLASLTNTPKAVLSRMFMQRARDRFESIGPGATARWTFPAQDAGEGLAVRIRFSSDFNMRDEVRGVFAFGDLSGSVSNITKSILKVPLARGAKAAGAVAPAQAVQTLEFANSSPNTLMLRPRKDLKLLAAADSFAWNMVRAWLQLSAMLATVCAFAVFLGSCLGRTVAVFTCGVMLFTGAASSDIIESYPDQLEENRVDRISLAVTRAVEFVCRPVFSLHPVAALADDECVAPAETLQAVAIDAFAIPALLALLSALAMAYAHESAK